MGEWPRFLLGRLAALVLTLLTASVLIFLALSLAPGDPATLLAGTSHPNPQVLARIRHEYHLDQPLWSQYWYWLSGVLSGDLGRSLVFRTDVTNLLGPRLGVTVFLVIYAGLLIVVAGLGLGVLAALRPGGTGTAITAGSAVAMGIPSFAMAVALIWLFATELNWFPVFGPGSGFTDRLWHLTLPAIALALSYVAYVSRVTRVAVSEELRSEHVETARSRGLPARSVLRRHVLRNAAGPLLTVSGITIAGLVAASVVVEQAFGLGGIGSLLIESAARKDIAVVQVLALLIVAVFIVVNTVVDVVSAALDPRISLGAKQ
jgi:peptide/nickel transport system permease protein